MGWFKKKDVPEELPNLAVDEIKIKQPSEEKQTENQHNSSPIKKLPTFHSSELKNKKNGLSPDDEQGYFRDLIKNVVEETKNLDKMDSWYKDKFLPGDIVFQMREYWENQQPEILLKNISGDLKNKLMEKTDKLHQLEKDWQEVYFHLLEKEEEIRKEEKELKESLSEFINIFKNASKRKKSK